LELVAVSGRLTGHSFRFCSQPANRSCEAFQGPSAGIFLFPARVGCFPATASVERTLCTEPELVGAAGRGAGPERPKKAAKNIAPAAADDPPTMPRFMDAPFEH